MQKDCHSVAVIGIGCWYPGAADPAVLWENILSKRQQFREFPATRLPLEDYYSPDKSTPEKTYGRRGAFVDGFSFDWEKRRIPKTVVDSTDIVHWLALEVALKAVAHAGYEPTQLPQARTCVLVGNTLTGEHTRSNAMRQRWPYVRRALLTAGKDFLPADHLQAFVERMEACYKSPLAPTTEDTLAGGLSNTIAGRICNFMNLGGGGYTVDGACASSLIAVANAAAAVARGDADVAIAGGVDVSLDTFELIGFAKTGALTAAEMSVYDKAGQGFVPGEGCGFVVLKSHDDAVRDGDTIYAVVRGWGISSDGKGGITAPKASGQATALSRAYARAGYRVQDLHFIEGHGTGTAVGDRVELQGIALAAQEHGEIAPRTVGMTSFKSLVGHTKAAAGIGGFIKAVLAVNQRVIPPTVGCETPHPAFDAEALGLYPVREGWSLPKDGLVRAGVSGMGFGGINCHVTLESGGPAAALLPPGMDEEMAFASAQQAEIFMLGAASAAQLGEEVQKLRALCEGMSKAELCDLAAQTNRNLPAAKQAPYRLGIAATSADDLLAKLTSAAREVQAAPERGAREISADIVLGRTGPARVGFLFPGQGSQQINMARMLVRRHSWARGLVEQADEVLRAHGFRPVSEVMFRPMDRAFGTPLAQTWAEELKDTRNAQVAICTASALFAEYLRRLGIAPTVVAGHSLGELAGLYAAGAMEFHTLIRLAAERGQAMAQQGSRAGAMASITCSEEQARQLLASVAGYAVVACLNGPNQTVLSGDAAAIADVADEARRRGLAVRELAVSNAFHSELVSDAAHHLSTLDWVPMEGPLRVPFISSLDAAVHQGSVALRPYCSRQLLAPVRFSDTARSLAAHCDIAVEVGPGRALSGMVQDTLGTQGPACWPLESRSGSDIDLARALAHLFVAGCDLHTEELYQGRLIRPFTPAKSKLFIDNPCERPMKMDASGVAAGRDTLLPLVRGVLSGIAAPAMQEYLQRRGQFLEQVIRADMAAAAPAQVHQTHRPAAEQAAPSARPAGQAAPVSRGGAGTIELLRAYIAQQTGFSAETLHGGLRLLDDLNLDSIKAGELIARMAAQVGRPGSIDPAPLLNATLAELAEALGASEGTGAAVKPAEEAREPITPYASLVRRVAERTGFEPGSLQPGLRMLDDLNLDSIKVAELVAQTAQEFGVAQKLDPVALANATLEEIGARIAAAATGSGRAATPSEVAGDSAAGSDSPSWVRDFSLLWAEEEVPANHASLEGRRVLLICSPTEGQAMSHELEGRGAAVATCDFGAAAERAASGEFSDCVVLLKRAGLEQDHEVAAALAHTAAIPTPVREEAALQSLTYVLDGPLPGVRGFAASLHLERPGLKVRVLEFAPGMAAARRCAVLADELSSPKAFVSARHDHAAPRKVGRIALNEPRRYVPRAVAWSQEDVVVVTGGGKGITAQCAIALAKEFGVRLALVGSSDFPGRAPDGEVGETLQQIARLGGTARYYACDVSQPQAVAALLAKIGEELGPVTAVVHGAGANKPRRAEQVSAESALHEMAPKLRGALNLLGAFEGKGLKLFCALTSIIGVTGMPGNAWYAYSNERVDQLVEDFAVANPATACFCAAFSVWDEVGMGARMGSVAKLRTMGIDPIPPRDGVDHFLALWRSQAPTTSTIVAARLAGLDTWERHDSGPGLPSLRFVQDVRRLEPGVELICRVHLHPDRDHYLQDHDYRGSLLFPTVFGMEAMAQASAKVLGSLRPFEAGARVTFESLRLERPIVVNKEAGTWVELRAQVEQGSTDVQRIHVSLHSESTGWKPSHFSATLVLGASQDAIAGTIQPDDQRALALDPATDLYGPLLFQGPRFQKIQAVRRLVSTGSYKGETVLESLRGDAAANAAQAFGAGVQTPLLLGDPFLRDTLLQSGQLLIPQHICLPVAIDRVDIRLGTPESGKCRMHTALHGRVERDVTASCMLQDEHGDAVEALHGYRVRIVDEVPANPTLEQLADLPSWEMERRATLLREVIQAAGVTGLHLDIEFVPGVHALPRDHRHDLASAMVQALWERAGGSQGVRLQWLPSGQPVLENNPSGVSISHDDDCCLMALHRGAPIGCDLALVTHRSRADWEALLGAPALPAFAQLLRDGEDIDIAGTRVWAARESVIKLGIQGAVHLQAQGDAGRWREFAVSVADKPVRVITTTMKRWRGGHCVAAFALELPGPQERPDTGDEGMSKLVRTWATRKDGVLHFHQQFPLQMDDLSTLEKRASMSRYYAWMGKLRELSLHEIMPRFAKEAETGRWGAVTNSSDLTICGDLQGGDQVLGVMHAVRLPDSDDSTMDLAFEWFRVRGAAAPVLVATSGMRTSWVEILGHGQVAKRPLPPFLRTFLDQMGERRTQKLVAAELGFAAAGQAGGLRASYASAFGAAPLLHSEAYRTDQEDSNLIGNVYHSNYAKWQCRTRDRFLHKLDPTYFVGKGPKGEWVSVRSRMTYLRDAMPFDTVEVDMHLLELRDAGMKVGFAFYRADPNGQRTKLAQGEQFLLWLREDGDGERSVHALPQHWMTLLDRSKHEGELLAAPK